MFLVLVCLGPDDNCIHHVSQSSASLSFYLSDGRSGIVLKMRELQEQSHVSPEPNKRGDEDNSESEGNVNGDNGCGDESANLNSRTHSGGGPDRHIDAVTDSS
jgi:hypothetical protein